MGPYGRSREDLALVLKNDLTASGVLNTYRGR